MIVFKKPHIEVEPLWHRAKVKSRDEVILFVHHYGGNHTSVGPQRRFFNRLGFDCVSFDLCNNDHKKIYLKSFGKNKKFGARHIWTDQIEDVLNQIVGPVIVFSQSMPSVSAVCAMAKRNCENIKGLICDGGPFFQFPRCTWNLYSHVYKINNPVFRLGGMAFGAVFLGYLDVKKDTHKALQKFPNNFPVLSIRGWKDRLVPPSAIDEVFEPHSQLDYSTLVIPEADHLRGLVEYPALYKARVEEFLNQLAN